MLLGNDLAEGRMNLLPRIGFEPVTPLDAKKSRYGTLVYFPHVP